MIYPAACTLKNVQEFAAVGVVPQLLSNDSTVSEMMLIDS